jgi:excisionase family DNA binding protein
MAMRAATEESVVLESAWITPRQAAAYLGVGVDTIYGACAAAELKHVKLGYRTIRLRREWIDRWAEKHAMPAD